MINRQNLLCAIVAILLVFTAARGLMRKSLLAGHDAAAYPVTQHQFHRNIEEGVLFPRWAPDMQYGFGHIKLQYRPPLLHYIAESFYCVTGDYYLCINLALILLIIVGGIGMFLFSRRFMDGIYAMVSVTAYLTANYFLADIYLRGAYYEVAAYAWMPWVLWSQVVLSERIGSNSVAGGRRRVMAYAGLVVGAFSWCFLICGHPQIATFFMPLALAFMVFLGFHHGNKAGVAYNLAICLIGILLSAPYVYVAVRELPYVRMQLFYVNLEDYYRHFLSVKQLFCETWPEHYSVYTGGVDYLGRPIHREMRSLNIWAVVVLLVVPYVWFWGTKGKNSFRPLSQFFYIFVIATVTISLSLSWGVWEVCSFLHTFNFPWRALSVACLCVAFLAGLLAEHLGRLVGTKPWPVIISVGIIALMLIDAFPHTMGWDSLYCGNLRSEVIRLNAGIPQRFYTPKWVRNYPTMPARRRLWVTEGVGHATLKSCSATSWSIDIDARTTLVLNVMEHYYPGWNLHGIQDLPMKPAITPAGTMAFLIPEGKFKTVLRFDLTNDRLIGYVLFLLGIVLLLSVCFLTRQLAVKRKVKTQG